MQNKISFHIKFLLASLVFLFACTPTLTTEYIDSPTYDVSKSKTWSWRNDTPIIMVGFLVGNTGKNIRGDLLGTTTDELNKRGFTRVARDEHPDFLVSFIVGAANQSQASQHRSNPSGLTQEPVIIWSQTNEYLEGGVSVIIRNPDNDEIMWQGIARDKLSGREVRALGKATVSRLVQAVMKKFPESKQ